MGFSVFFFFCFCFIFPSALFSRLTVPTLILIFNYFFSLCLFFLWRNRYEKTKKEFSLSYNVTSRKKKNSIKPTSVFSFVYMSTYCLVLSVGKLKKNGVPWFFFLVSHLPRLVTY